MTTETWVVLLLLGLSCLAGAFWSARRVDHQQAQAADILSRNAEQQRTADEFLRREAELLSRWETVVARLEAVATRWEAKSDAAPGTAPGPAGESVFPGS
jgi:hypothetical protein